MLNNQGLIPTLPEVTSRLNPPLPESRGYVHIERKGWHIAIPAIIGGLGIVSANDNARKQRNAMNSAKDLSKKEGRLKLEGLEEMMRMAREYDPHKETQYAVDQASSVTQDTMDKSLRGLAARFRSGGGDPGLGSEFAVKAQGMTNRVTDPLRQFIADRASTETERKMNAFRMATGATPGNLGDSYFRMAANMPGNTDSSGSLALLLQGLSNIGKKGGAGGSGDNPQGATPWLEYGNSQYGDPNTWGQGDGFLGYGGQTA